MSLPLAPAADQTPTPRLQGSQLQNRLIENKEFSPSALLAAFTNYSELVEYALDASLVRSPV
jgi:hypothetical protein